MTLDVSLLPQVALLFMLLFARIGTMMMLMPALGEGSISPRIRLAIALLLTLVFYPLMSPLYSVDATAPLARVMLLFATEFVIGFFVGLGARLITYTLSIAGMVIAGIVAVSMYVAVQAGANLGAMILLIIVAVALIVVTWLITAFDIFGWIAGKTDR